MNPSHEPRAFEEQAPFPGHPFGGLRREDGLGLIALLEDLIPVEDADDDDASEDAGGFDFHLGVYSKF